ncbi:unnamed protein product [Rotaria sp. Silwood1]|nr:unnamed protein product [Rotaria sp. Silwood1]CAF1471971.1 unnamed protein product [Rotaria sp. Silwood1]CAF1472523.1 unnamed protein product [Rotaria sp. Silwood1]CAF3605631.1 unnamed protein product [Rotaria sp. Silwood1]CAF3623828.1 unnamed protein product [Rotaria sp. Silwood1]
MSQLQVLDQQTDEFRKVANSFTDDYYQIIPIERIENETWRIIYEEEKKTIDKCHCSNQTDCVLFYGCLRTTSEAILQRGFDNRIVGITDFTS